MRYLAVILALSLSLAPLEAAAERRQADSVRLVNAKTKVRRNKVNGRKHVKRAKHYRNRAN
jgi:hypothetical protein